MQTADGEELRDIQVAGSDKVFVMAEAKIKGDVLEVWSKKVQHPRYVKYGYSPYTEGNLVNKFGVHYALAETSAAPRSNVPRSGRKPELHICRYIKGEEPIVESHELNTLFRTEFGAQVREVMFQSLRRIFVKHAG